MHKSPALRGFYILHYLVLQRFFLVAASFLYSNHRLDPQLKKQQARLGDYIWQKKNLLNLKAL
jgi:hypothetical protein